MRSRAIERVKGAFALAAFVAALAGPPSRPRALRRQPVAGRGPLMARDERRIEPGGISDRAVIEVLAVLASIIWAQLAVALVTEAVSILRGTPTQPGSPSYRACSRSQHGGLRPSPCSSRRSPPTPSVAATKSAPLAIPLHHEDRASLVVDHLDADPTPARAADNAHEPSAQRRDVVEYVVQRHDSFWDIAETTTGDPFRWREIRDLNVGRPQPDGGTVEAGSDLIRPGWKLLVPAVTQGPPLAAASGTERTVGPGDHLWRIADATLSTHLGRPASDGEVHPYWQSLVDLNRDVLADPGNPNLIFSGQVLRAPLGSSPGPPRVSRQHRADRRAHACLPRSGRPQRRRGSVHELREGAGRTRPGRPLRRRSNSGRTYRKGASRAGRR
jgi:nucleoid-associated protein YgaU